MVDLMKTVLLTEPNTSLRNSTCATGGGHNVRLFFIQDMTETASNTAHLSGSIHEVQGDLYPCVFILRKILLCLNVFCK